VSAASYKVGVVTAADFPFGAIMVANSAGWLPFIIAGPRLSATGRCGCELQRLIKDK